MEETFRDLPPPSEAGPIAVAMSGGVDSSAAAALLRERGYSLIGLSLQLYDQSLSANKPCCAGPALMEARRAAAKLGIPHYVLDYEKRFRDSVLEDFASSYMEGRTPSPCIRCNERVKFRDLLDFAVELGAETLATGHYARRVKSREGWEIWRAADKNRDQSYFLCMTTKAQLARIAFPLGGMTKDETRRYARAKGLQAADKPDSQDLCFVPKGRYFETAEKMRPQSSRSGEILHQDGRLLGRHGGIHRFTPGQRRIGVSDGQPLYVLRIEAEKGRIVVGPKEALRLRRLALRNLNWLGEGSLSAMRGKSRQILAQIRARAQPAPAALLPRADGQALLTFAEEQPASAAPGQACVFYEKSDNHQRMLGGGWIASEETAEAGDKEREA